MTKYAKIIDNDGLIRDMNSKAVLNVDIQAKQKYKKNKEFLEKMSKDVNKIKQLENDISMIKEDINEIKKMFLYLTKQKENNVNRTNNDC